MKNLHNMKNLHKLYYKDYFNGIDFKFLLNETKASTKASTNVINTIKGKNRDLCAPGLLNPISANDIVNSSFNLKIAYPGLVTGVGINHEANIEGEFKLGVHFDYTYGMPVVYGSSVKGVLRAYFKEFYSENYNEDTTKPNVDDIFNDIFEGGKKSIYNRDIFFDAVITKPDEKGRILCSDSITPHGENPLRNPIPITFMKIAPGCEMEFRFKLVDSKIDGKTFSTENKKTLFEEIIKTVGVGAKTNVGYGQFE